MKKQQVLHTVNFKNECDTQELEFDLNIGSELTTIEVAPMDWHIDNDSYSDEYGVVPRFQPVVDKVMVTKVNGQSTPILMEMATRLINVLKESGKIKFTIDQIND